MITHQILASKNYAYIEVKGSPDVSEYCRAAKIFADDSEFTPELHRVCDFSQADLSGITISDINTFGAYVKINVPVRANTKIALIAPSANRIGIFETFSALIEVGNLRKFQNPEEAVCWVHTKSRPHTLIREEVLEKIQNMGSE